VVPGAELISVVFRRTDLIRSSPSQHAQTE
jgi:hypothetical protein